MRTALAPPPAPPTDQTIELLQQIMQKLDAIHAALTTRDRRRPSRTPLLPVLAATMRERSFTATDVLLDAEHTPALDAALAAARITSVRSLGKALAALEGRVIYGCRLERQGVKSDGVIYRVFAA